MNGMSFGKKGTEMKRFVSILLIVVLCVGFSACGGNETNKKITVGICQLTQHPALDKATEGFIDAVNEGLGKDNVEIINENASGDISSCSTIVNEFVAKNVDLIMANATPALQAAHAATSDITILGTAVTHYAPALDISLADWSGTVGGNISGTSDLADLKAQATMVQEWFPDAKKVAILFCSAEANSIFQASEVEKNFSKMDIETKEFTFTDSNDVASVTLNACEWADVIYIPTDNVAASNAEAIANVVIENKKPVIAGEKEACSSFGIAALSIDYYDLGVKTGEMAVEILKNGADVSTMEIQYAPFEKYYNKDMCDKLGITPLEGYRAIE